METETDNTIAPCRWNHKDLEWLLTCRLGRHVTLTITDNIRSMMSFRRNGKSGMHLRLHHMFLDASDAVVADIVEWMKNPARRSATVRNFMRIRQDSIRPGKERPAGQAALEMKGTHHNLATLFARLNARFFDTRLEMRVTSGREPSRKRVRTMKLGSYCPATGIITMSPRLDRAGIPEYFVEYVLYHEMLHAAIGVDTGMNGRRRIHPPEFKRLERLYPDYARAAAFEKRLFGGRTEPD